MTRYLMINGDGVIENVVVGFVDLDSFALIEQTTELSRVGPGWVYDAALDAYVDPRAPALTAFTPDISQDEFVWSEELGTYVNAALLQIAGA